MEVTRIAGELKKMGRKVYPLSAGDTHFPTPQVLIQKLNHLPFAFSHYTNADGIEPLRAQIAKTVGGYEPENVLLVPGLKQGLYYALHALQNKKLCVLEPAWLGYQATATLVGYDYISVNMYEKNWLKVLSSIEFDTLIICAPNNPDGKIFSVEETSGIIKSLTKNNAWLVADLIYERFCYTKGYNNFFSLITEYNKLIIANGFSKSHAMTGFRVGYLMLKDKKVMERMLIMQQNIATCVSAIGQYLLIDAAKADTEIDGYVSYYEKNRELVVKVFPEWAIYKPLGGFYYFVDLRSYGITDCKLFCEQLLQQTGVALVHGGAYGKGFDSYIRLSFSIDKDELQEALNKLAEYLNNKSIYKK